MKEKKDLLKALADFQNEVPIIHQSTKGYNYTYTDLPKIITVIKPLLKKHGLGFTQIGTGTGIKTIVFHVKTGQSIEGEFEIPQDVKLNSMNTFQVLGSAITYIRRYSLSSMLGLVTDKDVDSAGTPTPQPIKPPVAAPVKVVTPSEASKQLNACKSLEELKKVYGSLRKEQQSQFVELKDQMKEKLTVKK